MGRASKQLLFTVTANSYPAWVDTAIANGWIAGTWSRISGVAPTHGLSATSVININALDPGIAALHASDGHNAVCSAWAGAVFLRNNSTHGTYGISNGGHNNYYGNEFYGFDLGTREWARMTEPYPTPNFPVSSGVWPAHGLQVNGSPAVEHTYDMVVAHQARNSFYVMRCQVDPDGGGSHTPKVCELPMSTLVWQPRALGTQAFGSGGWSCYDSTRQTIVYRGGGGVGTTTSPRTISYDPATNTHTYYNPSSAGDIAQQDGASDYNPIDDMICHIRGGSPNTLVGIPAGSLSTTRTVLTISNPSGDPGGEQHGWGWSDVKQAFIRYPTNGANVYQFKKSGAGAWQTTPWTWSLLTTSSANAPEDMEVNGVYSKFQIVEYGAFAMAIVVKRTGATGTGAMYAFRLS